MSSALPMDFMREGVKGGLHLRVVVSFNIFFFFFYVGKIVE